MLTLDRPAAAYEVMRVVDPGETGPWSAGRDARRSSGGGDRVQRRHVQRPAGGRGADQDGRGLRDRYETPFFDVETMICAGAADPDQDSSDPCQERLGRAAPRARRRRVARARRCVLDGLRTATAAAAPGIYARIGDEPLNAWVHSRHARGELPVRPRAARQRARDADLDLAAPGGRGLLHDLPVGSGRRRRLRALRRERDRDDDSFPTAGRAGRRDRGEQGGRRQGHGLLRLQRRRGPERPAARRARAAGPHPHPARGDPEARGVPRDDPRRPSARRSAAAASTSACASPARRRPAIAVVEVYRGKRKIGIARGRVRRGGTRRISVRLTPTGRRLLTRSATKRLKLRVRVRVGRSVLRSKTLTVRR